MANCVLIILATNRLYNTEHCRPSDTYTCTIIPMHHSDIWWCGSLCDSEALLQKYRCPKNLGSILTSNITTEKEKTSILFLVRAMMTRASWLLSWVRHRCSWNSKDQRMREQRWRRGRRVRPLILCHRGYSRWRLAPCPSDHEGPG